mgnify:FL=1
MINAYKNFFKGYVDFAGRSTRSDYWWIWLGNMIIYIPFFFSYGNAISNPQDEGALIGLGGTAIIYMVIGLALLLPSLALMVRRLRDAGFHWALIFILFVPLGSIVLLVLLAMPTKEEATPAISEAQEVRVEEVIEASPFEETDNK